MSDTIIMPALAASACADGNAAAFLGGVLEAAVDVAVIATDQRGCITYFSLGAERLLDVHAEEQLGRPAAALFRWPLEAPPRTTEPDISVFETLTGAERDDEPARADCLSRGPDGSWRRLHLRVSRLLVAGEAAGHVCVAFEVIESARQQGCLQKGEQALCDSEAHFRQLFYDHDAVMMLVDPHSGTIADANPSAERFYGYPREAMVGMPLSRINILSQDELADKYRSAFSKEQNSFIFRHRLASGDSRLVEVHSSPVSRHGRSLLFSIIHDVTARRAAEHALHLQQQHLSAVIESFQGGVLVEDNQGKVLLANQSFCDMFTLDQKPAELPGRDGRECAVAISSQFAAPKHFLNSIDRVVSRHRLVSGEQLAMADGRTLERDHVPILLDGVYSGLLWIYRDITKRKQQQEELFLLATTDALTGVANRRTFMLRLSEECARFRRNGVPASLLMLDIDHFKSVNDIHGHAAGDRALKSVVDLCGQSLRTTDTLGRLGGEEFAVLLPACPEKNARDVAEALRLAILSHVLWHEGVPMQLTVSIGVAAFAAEHADGESVLLMADRALYEAKQAGRNRVRVFSGTI
ncbi:MAG: diguanylate cyclase [Pseudogulbenkiania sp.]|nr:diguanylate cyclase [Pseudogulbenkiania sp.]